MPIKLSKRADYILQEIAILTHPDTEFQKWVANPDKSVATQESELLEKGLVYQDSVSKELFLTKAGKDYIAHQDTSIEDLIRQIKNVIPKNPSFQYIAENLSDTALIRAFYTILSEVGRRGDPDQPEKYAYWVEKCKAFEAALENAEPNGLWEKHGVK